MSSILFLAAFQNIQHSLTWTSTLLSLKVLELLQDQDLLTGSA